MKKLELKHLAAYLPYGVKALKRDMFPPNEYKVTVMKGLRLFMLSQEEKIILRPLSDLTKPITHNGETFVPIEGVKWHESSETVSLAISRGELYYETMTYLHSLHFDTFGLIEDGLAIDINTLNEQK